MTVPTEVRNNIQHLVLILLCCISIVACNEAPTSLGTSLITGTDTLYAMTSGNKPLLDSFHTVSSYPVMYNPAYVLFGKTSTDEGRLFLQVIEYPSLGDTAKWEVLECALGMLPQPYVFGDSTDATLGMKGYELTKEWDTQITWDSVWSEDGTTNYYSTSGPVVTDTSLTIAPTDTLVYVNFNKQSVRRWLVKGADSAQRSELFGMVLLPTNQSSIRQYRNANQNVQTMLLRVVTKNVDKSTPDTTFLKTAVASFVHTAPPSTQNELLVQGARVHSTQFTARIDSLPPFAIVVGASFTVYVNKDRSVFGTGGIDETLELEYTDATGSVLRFQAPLSDSSKYVFQNVSALAQRIQRDGGTGTLKLQPASLYNTWRMNRMVLHDGTDPTLTPRLMIVYTIPSVLK